MMATLVRWWPAGAPPSLFLTSARWWPAGALPHGKNLHASSGSSTQTKTYNAPGPQSLAVSTASQTLVSALSTSCSLSRTPRSQPLPTSSSTSYSVSASSSSRTCICAGFLDITKALKIATTSTRYAFKFNTVKRPCRLPMPGLLSTVSPTLRIGRSRALAPLRCGCMPLGSRFSLSASSLVDGVLAMSRGPTFAVIGMCLRLRSVMTTM